MSGILKLECQEQCLRSLNLIIFIFSFCALAAPAVAQIDDAATTEAKASLHSSDDGGIELEEIYDQTDQKEVKAEKQNQSKERSKISQPKPDVNTLSDLGNLAPFSDIAIIQRRFLPKTGRFEFSPAAITGLNNPFFNSLGLSARVSYYFQEKYAVEAMYSFLSVVERDVTKNLENKRNVRTQNLVTPSNFAGVAFKWNPVYGKMTFLNHRIVPFDLNFSAGFGMTTTSQKSGEPTLFLGTGQVFALSKAMAFRWDFNLNLYQATTTDAVTQQTTKATQNDMTILLGMSFYFPEASYR